MKNEAKKFGALRFIRHLRMWEERLFFQRIRQGIHEGQDHSAMAESLVDDDFIIFDDLGSTRSNEWHVEVILGVIDYRYTSQKPTMVTTNLTELEVKERFGARIHSRLFSTENTKLAFGQVDLRSIE